jgi:hypothetical protein
LVTSAPSKSCQGALSSGPAQRSTCGRRCGERRGLTTTRSAPVPWALIRRRGQLSIRPAESTA